MAVVYFTCLHCHTKTPTDPKFGIFVCPVCMSVFDIKKREVPLRGGARMPARKIPFPMGGEQAYSYLPHDNQPVYGYSPPTQYDYHTYTTQPRDGFGGGRRIKTGEY